MVSCGECLVWKQTERESGREGRRESRGGHKLQEKREREGRRESRGTNYYEEACLGFDCEKCYHSIFDF